MIPDGDGHIDSIDPDPLDATVNQMPNEWHKTEFIPGVDIIRYLVKRSEAP